MVNKISKIFVLAICCFCVKARKLRGVLSETTRLAQCVMDPDNCPKDTKTFPSSICGSDQHHPYDCYDGTRDPSCGGGYETWYSDERFDLSYKTLKFVPVGNTYLVGYENSTTFTVNPKNGEKIDRFLLEGVSINQGPGIRLPFVFPFMGKSYNVVYPDKKGQLTFDDLYNDFKRGKKTWWSYDGTNEYITRRIVGFSSQLRNFDADVSWKVSWNGKKLAVTYENYKLYDGFGKGYYGWSRAPPSNFQIVLHSTGEIWFTYLDMGISETCDQNRWKECAPVFVGIMGGKRPLCESDFSKLWD